MTLKDLIQQDLVEKYSVRKYKIERDESRGRPGIEVELTCGNVIHTFFFAAINKMTPEHMVSVMDSYLRHGNPND